MSDQAIDARLVATFDPSRAYRYSLWRRVGEGESVCLFVMLNPSTADETQDDPTIRRCMAFAKAWGYGMLAVGNLFAYRATDPKELKGGFDPVGPGNIVAMIHLMRRSDCIVAAWGSHGRDRETPIRNMLRFGGREVNHLGLTKQGEPRHPLYVKADTELQVWA